MLNTLIEANQPVMLDALWSRKQAYLAIQNRLSDLGLVDPEFLGDVKTPFGPTKLAVNKLPLITLSNALAGFMPGFEPGSEPITREILESLAQATSGAISVAPNPADSPQLALTRRVIAYMQAKGMFIARDRLAYNIVYVEGIEPDGSRNSDAPDAWNDVRLVFQIDGNEPVVRLCVKATTEPGKLYTMSKQAEVVGGAARIAFGQYKAWMQGFHKQAVYGTKHPALVQRGLLRAHRDLNKDMMRTNDRVVVGSAYGMNQHSTKDGFKGFRVDIWSAGCLVGWLWYEHEEFMDITLHDGRFMEFKNYLYITAVLPGNEL